MDKKLSKSSKILLQKRKLDKGSEKLLQLQSEADDKVDSNYMLKMKQAMIDNEKETAKVTHQILGDILLKHKEPKVSKDWLDKKKS